MVASLRSANHGTHTPALVLFAFLLLAVGASTARGDDWSAKAGQLSRTEITAGEAQQRAAAEVKDRRGCISMRRIKPAMPGVDWNADPTAIPYLLYQVNKRTSLPVYIDNEGLDLATDDIFQYTTIYLTSHGRWSFNEKEGANVARWLKRGGTLLLEDCYNRGSAFSDCVHPEVAKMLPGIESQEVAQEDPRVSDTFRMVYPTVWPGQAFGLENHPWQYFLLDGRPAVFYCPNDDGCGWEVSTPPTASNPIGEGIGHGGDNRARELYYQWATNWMLFAYTH